MKQPIAVMIGWQSSMRLLANCYFSLVQSFSNDEPFELQAVDSDWQSALLFETHEQIYIRVYRTLRRVVEAPAFCVSFEPFANADSRVEMKEGKIRVRVTDLLAGAPAPVLEALAYVLLGKLLRRAIPAAYAQRYRLYLNRKDMRQRRHLVRQLRGRKFLSGPQGESVNLETVFERINARYFDGLMGRPNLGWSRGISRSLLGHFDPSHNAIIISRLFDNSTLPTLALDYVMFHEMLHLQFPVDHSGRRRCVHTPEFKAAEKNFLELDQARLVLKRL